MSLVCFKKSKTVVVLPLYSGALKLEWTKKQGVGFSYDINTYKDIRYIVIGIVILDVRIIPAKITMSTSDSLDIDSTYIETPTVTATPVKNSEVANCYFWINF